MIKDILSDPALHVSACVCVSEREKDMEIEIY